ncbi:MAG: sensor domain-containing diguanylate cyclase [Pseudomonadota bacterium]
MLKVKSSDNGINDLVRLSFFVDIAKSISRSNTIDETLEQVMKNIGEIFTPRNWSLLLKEPNSDTLKFAIVIGEGSDNLVGKTLLIGEGVAGWIAEKKESVIIDNVQSDERFSGRVDAFTGFETTSIIGVPLCSGDKVFGVIELINKINGHHFTSMELKILTTIADFAAIAIEKAYYSRALRKLASCDSMTGLYNRGSFDKFLSNELLLKERYDTPLSLLMLDIDDFKLINDNFGHQAGDQVILSLAKILKAAIREVDKACRYGGDEFIIILPNTNQQQCEVLRQRIKDMIQYENTLNGNIPFKVSIGTHFLTSGDKSTELGLLDAALYKEKANKEPQDVENLVANLNLVIAEERAEQRGYKK